MVGQLQQTGVSKQFLCRLPGARQKLVQYDLMDHPKGRASALVVETAEAVGPNELTFTRPVHYRDVLKLLVEGKRARPMEYSRNGTQYVAEGRNLPNNGAALAGQDTPWVYKCP